MMEKIVRTETKPQTDNLFEECRNNANHMKKLESNKIIKYNTKLYNQLLAEINDFTTIKKAITKEMSNNHTYLSYLASYIKTGRGRMPSGAYSIIPLEAMHVWSGDGYYDDRTKMGHIKDIFTTMKYGDIILRDLLQEKLQSPFRLMIVPSTFWVKIEWGEIVKKNKNDCVIL